MHRNRKTKHRGGAALLSVGSKRKRDNECFICFENMTESDSGDNKEKIILHKVGPVEHAVCLECAYHMVKINNYNIIDCPLCREPITVTKKDDIVKKWGNINEMPPPLQEEDKKIIEKLEKLLKNLEENINRANQSAERGWEEMMSLEESLEELKLNVGVEDLRYFMSVTNRVRAEALKVQLKVMVERLKTIVRLPISGATNRDLLSMQIINLKKDFIKNRSWFYYIHQRRRQFARMTGMARGIKRRKTKKKSNRRKKNKRKRKSKRRR